MKSRKITVEDNQQAGLGILISLLSAFLCGMLALAIKTDPLNHLVGEIDSMILDTGAIVSVLGLILLGGLTVFGLALAIRRWFME